MSGLLLSGFEEPGFATRGWASIGSSTARIYALASRTLTPPYPPLSLFFMW